MKNNAGYTLIEVIIALAVFALLAVMSTSAIYHTFNTRARLAAQTDTLNKLQLAVIRIRRDTEQWVERSTRGNEGRMFPAIIGESNYVEFTRTGLVNANDETRSTLERVAYVCLKSKLIIRTFEMLDGPNRKKYEYQMLIDNLNSCSFSYLSPKRENLPEWQIFSIQNNTNERSVLPMALIINIEPINQGALKLLFVIPEGLYGGQ